MSFFKKIFRSKGSSKWAHRVVLGLDRKQWKKARKHVGLTSDSKWVRALRRSIKSPSGTVMTSDSPTSASTYQYQPRSIASLMR